MTQAQQKAANPAHSVWLSAHAGTGKTKVLVDRVLRILLRGDAPSSIICLTYTKAAATEMQARLRNMLSDWVQMEPAKLYETLETLIEEPPSEQTIQLARSLLCRVMDDAHGVRIQTIHAFCQSLLARFPLEAQLAPHIQLMDDRTSHELLREARRQLLEALSRQNVSEEVSASFERLVIKLSDKGLHALLDVLCKEHVRIQLSLSETNSMQQIAEAVYGNWELSSEDTAESILSTYLNACDAEAVKATIGLLLDGGKRMQSVGTNIDAWMKSARNLQDFEAYVSTFRNAKGEPYTSKWLYGKFAESNPQAVSVLESEQGKTLECYERLTGLQVAQFTMDAYRVAEALLGIYAQLKKAAGWLDYDDIILHTKILFDQPGIAAWIMEKLDQHFTHILIDEAQDTSPEQWALVRFLVSELFDESVDTEKKRSLFVVGDEKQSIYRFQGADPRGFKLWRDYYDAYFDNQRTFHALSLDRSFRSSDVVLDVVDRVCASVFPKAGIAHDVHRTGQAGRVELLPLLVKEKYSKPNSWEWEEPEYLHNNPVTQLAEQLADTIKGWLNSERELPSKARPVDAGDILILLKKRNPMAKPLMSALKRAGIPVAGADRLAVNAHLAVQDVMAIAKWALFSADDLTLAAVLKGPWFNLSEEQLYHIASDRGVMSLWQALQKSDAGIASRLTAIKTKLSHMSPHDWLLWMIDVEGGREACRAHFGDEIDELFDELLNQAHAYESMHTPSMQGFIAWLEASEQDIKRELEQSAGAVRVMTVHGAKGLQAPIVILPDTVHTIKKPSETLWWSDNDELEFFLTQPVGVSASSVKSLQESAKNQELEEYDRLLYVAMTRAEDELYVCGWQGSSTISSDTWYSKIKAALSKHDNVEEPSEGHLVLASSQTALIKSNKEFQNTVALRPSPDWLDVAASKEAPFKLYSPSHLGAEEKYDGTASSSSNSELARERGNAIHALLEWMPIGSEIPNKADMLHVLEKLVEPCAGLDFDAVVDEVLAVRNMPECEMLFSDKARAEISLVGYLHDSLPISGQIDRLIVDDKRIVIVDFKSNREVPESVSNVSKSYLVQLWVYAELLKQTYPEHKIETALVWTAGPSWMEIPEAALRACADHSLDSLAG